jgi:hypothetical protein
MGGVYGGYGYLFSGERGVGRGDPIGKGQVFPREKMKKKGIKGEEIVYFFSFLPFLPFLSQNKKKFLKKNGTKRISNPTPTTTLSFCFSFSFNLSSPLSLPFLFHLSRPDMRGIRTTRIVRSLAQVRGPQQLRGVHRVWSDV